MEQLWTNRVQPERLDLEALFTDLPVLTNWRAGECYYALLFCLEHHKHRSGVIAELRSLAETLDEVELVWTQPLTDDDRRNWGAPRLAVEHAAEGIAWLIIYRFTRYTIIKRSHIGSGIDFWLGDQDDVDQLEFNQRKARLEVKGRLDPASDSVVRSLVAQALAQTERSDASGLPAFVIVADFSEPIIYMEQR